MPKRKPRKKAALPAGLVTLVLVALFAFAAGEAWLLLNSDSGRLKLARYFGLGDPARVTLIIGRQVHHGLAAFGVPPDSIHDLAPAAPESSAPGTPRGSEGAGAGGATGRPVVRWRVGLDADQSLFQANYAISHFIEAGGGVVLSGRETQVRPGGTAVTLRVGLPGRATHEITLVRRARVADAEERPPARLALVLYGFGDDPARAAAVFGVPVPFAVALAPGAPWSGSLFRAARRVSREVVLHLPLEPINYPQVTPGPGTVLVTMKPGEITGLTRRYIDQAGPVAAVANHMGSLATQDMTVMSAVYRELKRRHLPFIHLAPAAGAVCRPLAAQLGVMYEEPDAVLDGETRGPDVKALDRRWDAVLAEARARGSLMVWLRASPLARDWLTRATDPRRLQGVDLVPLSSLLRRPAEL
jgi:polysaccharide deacetylase 2 family uncharacterized protein YibQ